MRYHRNFFGIAFSAITFAALVGSQPASGQTANGRATTAAPTYTNGAAAPLSLDTAGNLRTTSGGSGLLADQVQGNSPSLATDVGNPVKIGGVFNSTTPTVANGQRVDLQTDNRGQLRVMPSGISATSSDGFSNTVSYVTAETSLTSRLLMGGNYLFNGTTWDRQRGDTTGTYTVGNVASGATDAGNPVKIGGVFNTTAPTLSNGQRGDAQLDTSGRLKVNLGDALVTSSGSDGRSNTSMNALNSYSFGSYFNGATWDRVRGDINGAYAQGNVASGATDAGNPVKTGGVFNSTLPTLTDGQRGNLQLNPKGAATISMAGTISGDAANATISGNTDNGGTVRPIAVAPYVFNGSTYDRQRGDTNGTFVQAPVNSGTSNFSLIAANTTNSTNVKNAAGIVTEISVYNNSATIGYLKLYNSASAPTCGSGTPVGRYMIPASTSGAGSNVNIPLGKYFSTGISFCVTAAIGDSDTTAVAANAYLINLTYK